jgi:transcriptional regulator with XRE-family HTH domain
MSFVASSNSRSSTEIARDSQLSTEEWEVRIGEQVRRARLAADLEQSELAEQADVSVGALRNLERGNGSTVRTLVRVVRALGQEPWLNALAPAVSVSPIDILRTGRPARSRVYRARAPRTGGHD